MVEESLLPTDYLDSYFVGSGDQLDLLGNLLVATVCVAAAIDRIDNVIETPHRGSRSDCTVIHS